MRRILEATESLEEMQLITARQVPLLAPSPSDLLCLASTEIGCGPRGQVMQQLAATFGASVEEHKEAVKVPDSHDRPLCADRSVLML